MLAYYGFQCMNSGTRTQKREKKEKRKMGGKKEKGREMQKLESCGQRDLAEKGGVSETQRSTARGYHIPGEEGASETDDHQSPYTPLYTIPCVPVTPSVGHSNSVAGGVVQVARRKPPRRVSVE